MKETMAFAKSELENYWQKVTGENRCDILLSLFPVEERSDLDDEFEIRVDGGKGGISASNARSVLLGVYALFRELGCRFLYPTKQGEEILSRPARECNVNLRQRASFRHRGVTIEGCVSCENVIDMIDWLPKVGCNSYFIQFFCGNIFYRKWYDHWWNPYLERKSFPREDSLRYVARAEAEMKKRGMLLHSVGHGWTCEPLGIPADGWDEMPDDVISDEMREKLALVNGERRFFHGMPITTNLCYSDPEIRKMMVREIVKYLSAHRPEFLHVWLADDCNNFCTCESCRSATPSDWYVTLLNELDTELTVRGDNTRIVFLLYNELMYPPIREKIHHPERFVLMFAPSGRSYHESFADGWPEEACGTLVAGGFVPPATLGKNIALLRAWQAVFRGDSFLFDYPLMHACCKELGGMRLARTIERDIGALGSLRLNGYLSCQLQRVAFPSGFPLYVLGRKLWNQSLSYEALKKEYFCAAYGQFAEEIEIVLERISSWLTDDYMHHRLPERDGEVRMRAERERGECKKLSGRIDEMISAGSGWLRERLKLISFCLQYTQKLLTLIEAKAGGEQTQVDALLEEIDQFLFAKEPEVQPYMDVGQYYVNVKILAGDHW